MTEDQLFHHHSIFAIITLLALLLLPLLFGPYQVSAQSTSNSELVQASIDTTGTPSIASKTFVLNYTGALYGYYRIEEPDPSAGKLEPPDTFLHHNWKTPPLLLGMGDNFGPEFGASIQEDHLKLPVNGNLDKFTESPECYLLPTQPPPGHKAVPPEIYYKDDDRLPKMAECDNVGRFLMWAGYRAIVPGKEDFLYSARWLRRMALLFRGASDPGEYNRAFPDDGGKTNPFIQRGKIASPDHRIHMLAANLRVKFTVEGFDLRPDGAKEKDKITKALSEMCPLLFSWDPLGSSLEMCLPAAVKGDTVTNDTDWLKRLDSTVDSIRDCTGTGDDCIPVAQAMKRQEQSDVSFRKQLLVNQTKILLSTLDPASWANYCPQEAAPVLQVLATSAAADVSSLADKLKYAKSDTKLNGIPLFFSLHPGDKEAFSELSELPEISKSQPCQSLLKDLTTVANDLHRSFRLWGEKRAISPTDTAPPDDQSVLFSLEARRASIHLLLRKIADKQRDVGYTIADHDRMRTLVVGVMGQKTMGAVSPANLQLCTQWRELNAQPGTTNLSTCHDIEGLKWPNFDSKYGNGRLVGTVQAGDPVLAVTTVVRAAWESSGPFDEVVVMAQMPFTEAEELAVRVRSGLNKTEGEGRTRNMPHVDLIVSEAQPGHTTPSQELRYDWRSTIPAVAPKPAWYITHNEKTLIWPVSTVKIRQRVSRAIDQILTNDLPVDTTKPQNETTQAQDERARTTDPLTTMSKLLYELLTDDTFDKRHRSLDLSSLKTLWEACHGDPCRNSVLQQFLLQQIHRHSDADVILLEQRDFYFGRLLRGYEKNKMCDSLPDVSPTLSPDVPNYPKEYCRVRIALDRVLWKGDVSERVMVDGKTLQTMLTTAEDDSDEEQSLLARDTVGEWLLTFGVVSEPPQNLSAASMGPNAFSVPGVSFCKSRGADPGTPQYCVNGQKITDDGAYWVSTSDHLAQDSQLYRVLKSLDTNYHEPLDAFITGEIADELDGQVGKKIRPKGDNTMGAVEERHQSRPILQLDYAKVVVGFMLRKPSLSDGLLATDFSGVTDSRATTPHAGEVDLEAVTRATRGLPFSPRLKIGVQSDLEYDRAFTGNLTGSPETVTYALNSFTTGGFLQYRLLGSSTLPHLLLVAAPYQYQTQITGNYLTFKFTTGTGQITIPTKRWEGFSQRFGLRYEFGGGKWMIPDSGSYAEGGPEYSDINNVLSGLSVNGTDCPVLASAFKACLAANNLSITSGTILNPLSETLHTGGAYWDVHLQKALDKHKYSSLTIETKGDYFMLPGVTLPTQSRYAFTTTGAVNFAVIGNLAFSPTYTTFFYKNQGLDNHSLVTNSFSVTAKWYFARDASVPFWRQWWFRGPASFDQTKSAKMK